MEWYPTLSYIKDAYEFLKLQYIDLENHFLMNENTLERLIDILKYGLPVSAIKLNIFERAGLFLYELINTHLFSEGNKRIAFIITYNFLKNNGYVLEASEDEKICFAIDIAISETCDYKELGKWLKNNSRKN